jgi:hypothetical protein
MIALSIEDRHNLALSGTFDAVFTASTHAEQVSAMLSTLTWRVFSGLSHLQDTKIVGKFEVVSPSERSASIYDIFLFETHSKSGVVLGCSRYSLHRIAAKPRPCEEQCDHLSALAIVSGGPGRCRRIRGQAR